MNKSSEWSNVGGGGNSFSTKIAFLPTSEEAIVRPSTYTNNSDEVYISGNGKVILVNVTDDWSYVFNLENGVWVEKYSWYNPKDTLPRAISYDGFTIVSVANITSISSKQVVYVYSLNVSDYVRSQIVVGHTGRGIAKGAGSNRPVYIYS